jgi:hypothetical protein
MWNRSLAYRVKNNIIGLATFGEMYKIYIMVTLIQKDDKFEVDVESKEYDYWEKKFVAKFWYYFIVLWLFFK